MTTRMATPRSSRRKPAQAPAKTRPATTLTSNEQASFRQQIAELIRKSLDTNGLGKGRRLPSVRRLAATYGVSLGTIANALSDLKKQGVLHAVRKKGVYTAQAAPSVGKSTRTLGVVAQGSGDSLGDRMYYEMFNGVSEVAGSLGLNVRYLGTRQSEGSSDDGSLPPGTEAMDAIVYLISEAPSPAFVAGLRRRKIPCVLTDWFDPAFGDGVIMDNIAGSQTAVEALVGLGHRRIAFLNSLYGQSAAEREQGYRAALNAAGIEFDPQLVCRTVVNVTCGFRATREMLQQQVTAIFCHNDYFAIGALLAAEAAGRKVPTDLSVVGFGDHAGSLGRGSLQRLATMHVDMVEMGRQAATQLGRRLDGDSSPPHAIRVPATFIQGDTIARATPPQRRN